MDKLVEAFDCPLIGSVTVECGFFCTATVGRDGDVTLALATSQPLYDHALRDLAAKLARLADVARDVRNAHLARGTNGH
jgi:hypothetical protein